MMIQQCSDKIFCEQNSNHVAVPKRGSGTMRNVGSEVCEQSSLHSKLPCLRVMWCRARSWSLKPCLFCQVNAGAEQLMFPMLQAFDKMTEKKMKVPD